VVLPLSGFGPESFPELGKGGKLRGSVVVEYATDDLPVVCNLLCDEKHSRGADDFSE
jgi:hypothetical protein